MAEEQLVLPIIDSHIHLFPESEADTLAWYTPENTITKQSSVEQYKEVTKSAPSLLGFVAIEADRKSSIDSGVEGWKEPLAEVNFLKRVALGQPRDGEGHTAEDAKLCLGIIPWAPVPSGAEVLEKYIELVKEEAGEAWPKVKGFRYLLQDKPHGTMLEDKFIEGLRYLGQKGFVFEVGVDQHRRGKKQLDELIAMIDKAHDGASEEKKVTFVINHLCKPDLTIYNITSDPSFHAWRTAIYTLGKCSNTYMKLSGGFAEMTDTLKKQSPNYTFESILGWLGIVLATFSPNRIMFGSDWPVSSDGVEDAWPRWKDVVERMCWMATLSDEDRAMIFGGTAKQAYKL